MKIEKVKVLTTLKCGSIYYQKGKIYSGKIPADLINEVRSGSRFVEVINDEIKREPIPKTVVEEVPTETDFVEEVSIPEEKPDEQVSSASPKLRRTDK